MDTQIEVVLFKPSGKYYTEERWRIPEVVPAENRPGATRRVIGPYDMLHSPDFRRIGGGAVLVPSQEPWGYPHLFPGEMRKWLDEYVACNDRCYGEPCVHRG